MLYFEQIKSLSLSYSSNQRGNIKLFHLITKELPILSYGVILQALKNFVLTTCFELFSDGVSLLSFPNFSFNNLILDFFSVHKHVACNSAWPDKWSVENKLLTVSALIEPQSGIEPHPLSFLIQPQSKTQFQFKNWQKLDNLQQNLN